MKKILTLLLLVVTLSVYSQPIKHGIHGGVNFSSMNYNIDNSRTTEYNMKFNHIGYIGYVLEYSIPTMKHKLQLELNINNNKSKYKPLWSNLPDFLDPFLNSHQKYRLIKMRGEFDLKQLTVPIILKFNSSKGVFINLGTYLGANLDVSSNTHYKFYNYHLGRADNSNIIEDVTDEFDFLDFGWVIGFEYNHKSGIFFEFRFNSGIKNISNNGNYIINKSIMFGLGYRI